MVRVVVRSRRRSDMLSGRATRFGVGRELTARDS